MKILCIFFFFFLGGGGGGGWTVDAGPEPRYEEKLRVSPLRPKYPKQIMIFRMMS